MSASSWSWPEQTSSSPPFPTRSDWGWSPQWWSLPNMEKWQKLYLWWGLSHTSQLCLLMLLLGLNFLPQPFQANTWPLQCTVLPTFFLLARHFQRLETLSQTLQEETYLYHALCPPHTDPIQQLNDFPHKPALDTCRSRCQKMSTLLHVLPKADPCLEGDVADDKADPSVCLQLNRISVLQYF